MLENTTLVADSEHLHSKDDYGLFFVILTLLIGILTRIVQKAVCESRFNIPYAVVLLIIGVVIGVLKNVTHLGPVNKTIETWENMGGRALVILFLPPLLFASSSTVDYHIFHRVSTQAFLLAVIGTLLSAALTGVVFAYVMPHDWSFEVGMLGGAMMSATDPVAVVALLKELGAPETLSVLIESESLLNDGIGYALFMLFLKQVTGASDPTMWDRVKEIVYASVVGSVIGVLCGILTIRMMGRIWNDASLEICLTIVMTWAVFLLGDAVGASGVLGVVAFGLAFASQSVSYLSGEVKESLHVVWHLLEYIANTLVFVYSGIVCTDAFMKNDLLDGYHVLYLFLLYILVNLIRFFMVGLLYPILQRSGYGMNLKSASLISWSGLRGAVGLVAAIEVTEQPSCSEIITTHCIDEDVKQLIMFYMAGIVVLTILINGTSTQWLIFRLDLSKRSLTAKLNYDASIAKLNEVMAGQIRKCKNNPEFSEADWNVVWEHMPTLSAETLQHRQAETDGSVDPVDFLSTQSKLDKQAKDMFFSKERPHEAMEETRYRFLNFVKASYNDQFEYGICGSWPSLRILTEAVATAQDDLSQPLNEWDGFIWKYCTIKGWRDRWTRAASNSKKRITRGYDIAFSFIKAHQYAEEKIKDLSDKLGTHEKIVQESAAMIRQARIFINDVHRAYEEIAASIHTGMVISETLMHTYEEAQRMVQKAEIEEHDFESIERVLSNQILKVKRSNGYVQVRTTAELFRALPFFQGLDEASIEAIRKHCFLRKFEHGDVVMERGEQDGYMYLILRGQVQVQFARKELKELSTLGRRGSSKNLLVNNDVHRKENRSSSTIEVKTRHLSDIKLVPESPSIELHDPFASPVQAERKACIGHRLCSDDSEVFRKESRTVEELALPTSPTSSITSSKSRRFLSLMSKSHDSGSEEESQHGSSAENEGACNGENDDVQPALEEGVTLLNYVYSRGDTIGELETIAQSNTVAKVTCKTFVEVFAIKASWLRTFMRDGPGLRLEKNLLRHAALQAIESFFPILNSAPESVRPWLLQKLLIRKPPAGKWVDPLNDGGIAVLLRGSLTRIGDCLLQDPILPITVYELPEKKQVYSEDTLLVLLPRAATSLLRPQGEQRPSQDRARTRRMSEMVTGKLFFSPGSSSKLASQDVAPATGANLAMDDQDESWLDEEEDE